MKSRIIRSVAIALVALSLFSGCYGKFRLTDKVYKWNGGLGDKYLVSLVGFVLLPVYSITLWVDGVILNSLEFWTGTNPMALKDGDILHRTVVKNGETFNVTAMKNRVDIVRTTTGEEAALFYNESEKNWYLKSGDASYKALSFRNNTLELERPDHSTLQVSLSTN